MILTSWDGNSFGSDYVVAVQEGTAIALPAVAAQMAKRLGAHPVVGGISRDGRTLPLGICIEGSDEDGLRTQLMQWMDPEDETPKQLVGTDDDGSSNERYLYAICERLEPLRGKGGVIPQLYVATMRVDGDVRWRSTDVVAEPAWNITASGQTKVVNNQGEDDAYPVVTVEPTSYKTAGNGFTYKRWCPGVWNATATATNYHTLLGPVNLSGKAQADGDDVRVYVDGVETDRWLGGTLLTSVKVWINLDFEARTVGEVATTIAGTGDVDEIVSSLDIGDFPSSGILLIESEAFVYTGKSDVEKTFTGVTRATKGTSMAAHVVGTTIQWIQHDVWLYYGDSSLSAPDVDDDYKPVIDLDASTNETWVYDPTQPKCDGFGEDNVNRPGAWTNDHFDYGGVGGEDTREYTDHHDTMASPWEELGMHLQPGGSATSAWGWWALYNPCGITGANFSGGEYYIHDNTITYSVKEIRIQTSPDGITFTTDGTATMSTAGSWQSWSSNPSLSAGARYVRMYVITTRSSSAGSNDQTDAECDDVVITLNSTYTPDVSVNGEQSNYDLACTITNQTTGKAITLSFGMELDEQLEVDTDQKTVTYLADNSGQMQALSKSGTRRDWLALQPGNNTLRYDETGVQGVTVDVSYEKRYYS